MSKQSVLLYADGSCRGDRVNGVYISNPGYSGFGIYGYSFIRKETKRQYKHPLKSNIFYTDTGLSAEKTTTSIEVIDIYEHIEFIRGNHNTNNHAELMAVITAMSKFTTSTDIEDICVMTDSNYVVTCFNDLLANWHVNGWKRADGKDVSHIEEWKLIDIYHKQLLSNDIKFTLKWVKGHSDNYGNELADIHSIIASNAAIIDYTHRIDSTVLLDQKIAFKDYNNSFSNKEFIYSFKNLYFNSSLIDDTTYSFLYNTTDKDLNIGKRNIESLFALNTGFTPAAINDLRKLHRSIERSYVTTCCININKLANKDVLRLINLVNPIYLLNRINHTTYTLLRDPNPFMYDIKPNIPLITDINKVFDNLSFVNEVIGSNASDIFGLDITDMFMSEGKLLQSNKEQKIDITDIIKEKTALSFTIKQKLILTMGRDLPSYLMLKSIEGELRKVSLYIQMDRNNGLATIYCMLTLDDREILVTNVVNKFSITFNH